MNGNNSQTKEGFLKSYGHPRKKELATMIFDGKTEEEMLAAGFGRINILEMARAIRTSVAGMEGLKLNIPRQEVAPTEPVADTSAPVEPVAPAPEAPVAPTEDAPVAPTEPVVPTPEAPVEPTAPDATVTEPVAPTAPVAPEVPTAPQA